MLSIIDKKLFPDTVELYKLTNGMTVYPIHKNGSSTLREIAVGKVDPSTATTVDIFVRDPYERFLSGVQTYIIKNNLDMRTTAEIVNQLYFLDNHFCPQLFWVINLARFTDAQIRINHLDTLSSITALHHNQQHNTLDDYFKNNTQLKYYLELDCVLYENFLGQTVSQQQIFDTVKSNYPELYNDTVAYSRSILNVLS